MSNDHEHPHPAFPPGEPATTPVDASSQALAEALRSSFVIVKIVMVALVAVFFVRGFFQVGPQERAIILRFGKPVGEGDKALLGAGLHWSFPYPIDEVVKVPITEIQKVTSTAGWYAVTAVQEAAEAEPQLPPNAPLNPAVDGYMLTADNNIVHARATLSYRIEDPIRFVFDFVNASNAVQNVLNNALLQTAARFKVDDILTRDKLAFQDAVRRRAVELVEKEKLGVAVELCSVESRPPRQLDAEFRKVGNARDNRDKALNGARTYENEKLSRTGAEAAALTNSAEAERTRLVETTAAAAEKFKKLLPQYERSPDLFVQQRLVETLGRVFATVQEKEFLPTSADGKPVEVRLLLSRELPKPKSESTGQ